MQQAREEPQEPQVCKAGLVTGVKREPQDLEGNKETQVSAAQVERLFSSLNFPAVTVTVCA